MAKKPIIQKKGNSTSPESKQGAPKGNQFWRLRSKHGRDKLFATPELMWQAACKYFEWCDNNPLIEVDYRGRDLCRVELPKMRAYTLHGLCLYLNCNTQYFKTFKAQLKKEDVQYEDFNTVITRIEEAIYNQKFSGAAAGFLNANIIARDLGLQDKQVQTHENPDGSALFKGFNFLPSANTDSGGDK